MPTGHDELRLIIHSNGQVIISHKTYYEEAEAVPVPEHGDLIDRNALPWEKQGKMLTDPDEWGIDARDIEAAPIIIPADPAEEGET